MKCESIQNELLREQTGELPWFKRWWLATHLRKCEACRRFREETELIMELGKSPEPGRKARPDTMERIMQAAREEKSRSVVIQIQPERELFLFRRHPALVSAACGIALAVGVWVLLRPGSSSSPGSDLVQQKEAVPIAPTKPCLIAKESEAILPGTPPLAAAELSWDSPIGNELAELNQALSVTASEEIFAEVHPEDSPDPDSDALIQELLELEGVQI